MVTCAAKRLQHFRWVAALVHLKAASLSQDSTPSAAKARFDKEVLGLRNEQAL